MNDLRYCIKWKKPEIDERVVTTNQLKEFNEAFSLLVNEVQELEKQNQNLRSQYSALKKESMQIKKDKEDINEKYLEAVKLSEQQSNFKIQKSKPPKLNDTKSAYFANELEKKQLEDFVQNLSKKKNELEKAIKHEQKTKASQILYLQKTLDDLQTTNDSLRVIIEHFQPHEDLSPPTKASPQLDFIQTSIQPNEALKDNIGKKCEEEIEENRSFEHNMTEEQRQKIAEIEQSLKDLENPILQKKERKKERKKETYQSPYPDESLLQFPPLLLDFKYFPKGDPISSENGKRKTRIETYSNGDKLHIFSSSKVLRRSDGTKMTYFSNNDIQKDFPDTTVAYFYGSTGDIDITLPNGTIHKKFHNGQREVHFPNGDLYIEFPDKTTKFIKQ